MNNDHFSSKPFCIIILVIVTAIFALPSLIDTDELVVTAVDLYKIIQKYTFMFLVVILYLYHINLIIYAFYITPTGMLFSLLGTLWLHKVPTGAN